MGKLVNEAIQKLRSQGGRLTSQRRMILETLERVEGHPTAEDLFAITSRLDPNLNLSTIYRTLNWLEAEGLVSARHFGENPGAGRFDAASPTEHHHFICSECKKVIEFEHPFIDGLKEQFAGQQGCRVETASVVLTGLCSDCYQKKTRKGNLNQ